MVFKRKAEGAEKTKVVEVPKPPPAVPVVETKKYEPKVVQEFKVTGPPPDALDVLGKYLAVRVHGSPLRLQMSGVPRSPRPWSVANVHGVQLSAVTLPALVESMRGALKEREA